MIRAQDITGKRDIIHIADKRRKVGRYALNNPRVDGTGYVAIVIQYPVICALDWVELSGNQGAKREHVVTDDPRRTTCPDCKSRR